MACAQGSLVLIRFREEQTLSCRNDLIKGKNILKNYGGSACGVCQNVTSAEGEWPRNKDMALVAFAGEQSQRWFNSAPEPREPDWLGGAEAMMVPLIDSSRAPLEGAFLSVVEVYADIPSRFCDVSYTSCLVDTLCERAAVHVAGGRPRSLRSSWCPTRVEVIAWQSEQCFHDWMTGECSKQFHALRRDLGRSNISLCYLGSVMTPCRHNCHK